MSKGFMTRRGEPEPINPYEQLINYTMLYNMGDECSDLTGGWNNVPPSSQSAWNAGLITANTINVSGYASSFFKGNIITRMVFGITASTTIPTSQVLSISTNLGNSTAYTTPGLLVNGIRIYDISSVSTTNRITLFDGTNSNVSGSVATKNSGNMYFNFSASQCTCFAIALLKSDDWATLCTKAGISAPATLADLLSNGTSLNTILSSSDATDFMVARCTGTFMGGAMQSSTFVSALNASPYKSKVQANTHWAKFLAMIA